MYPKLFEIPWLHWPINSYGFMIMIGFLLATYVAVRRAKTQNINPDLILDIGIISMIFGIVGAKINYILQYPDTYGDSYKIFDLADGGLNWLGGLALGGLPLGFWYWRTKEQEQMKLYSWRNGVLLVTTLLFALVGSRALFLYQHQKEYHWNLITSWQSGFVLYGGLLAGIVTGAVYTKMRKGSILQIGDIAAPSMMLGLVFGRIGCLFNGCCWGKPSDLPWAIRFPEGSDAAREIMQRQIKNGSYTLDANATNHLRIHPTQIYESIAALVIFFALSWYWKNKKKNNGEVFLILGMAYPAWRFIVEFWRDDERPLWLGPLSYSQTLGLAIFIVCGVALFFLRNRPATAELPKVASEAAVPAAKTDEKPAK